MRFKKIISLILIVMVILGMSITAKAANTTDTYKINLTATNKTIKQGETITISLNVSDINIQTGDKGIGAYDGKIEYDTNVFEELKMSGNDNWDKPAENEGIFTSVNSDGLCVQEAQEIAQITLKAKSTAKLGTTTVKITGFKASNAVTKVPTDDTSINITINSASTTGSDNLGGNGSGAGTSSGTTSKTQSQTKKSTSTTTKNTKLPKTGVSNVIIGITGIVAIIGIYGYIRYMRYKSIF